MKKYLYSIIAIVLIASVFMTVQVFATIDTSSTNNADTDIYSDAANTNNGTSTYMESQDTFGTKRRSIIRFTLPSLSGTITGATLNLLANLYGNAQCSGGATSTQGVYTMTRTTWTEGNGVAGSGATWNKYDGTNNWTTAGGDYSTEIGSTTWVASSSWQQFPLQGSGTATTTLINPMSLTFGSTINLEIRNELETHSCTYVGNAYLTKDNGVSAYNPYLSVTYTSSGGTTFINTSGQKMLMSSSF